VAPAPAAEWSYLSFDEDSGYGVAAQRAIAALEASGQPLAWTPFVEGAGWRLGYEPLPDAATEDEHQVVIAHLVAEYLPIIRARRPDAFLVAHTVWDTDRIPDHWVGCLDAADLIVVPSLFSQEAINRSEVTKPVAIVPHVAPPPINARPWDSAELPDDVLVFYTIASWNERKAVHRTVEAYLRAFTGDDRVLLVVKTSHRDERSVHALSGSSAGEGTTPWSLAQLLAAHANPPAVRLITRALASEEVSALHRRGDCFVSLARCEGWGLGAFDAAAYGKPVVTTGFGGQLDYLAGAPHLVRFDLVPVQDPSGFPSYAPYQRWAEPDVDHAAKLLREVAADPQRAAALAEPIAADIRWRYRPAAVAATFRAAVDQHHAAGARERMPAGTDLPR
jgi:glycosyltransferase involved in cell wall biosynthesis